MTKNVVKALQVNFFFLHLLTENHYSTNQQKTKDYEKVHFNDDCPVRFHSRGKCAESVYRSVEVSHCLSQEQGL